MTRQHLSVETEHFFLSISRKWSGSVSVFLPVPPIFQRVTNTEAAWGLGHEGDNEDRVQKRDVVLGHSVSLSCESNAIPPPKLSWYKDGRKLTSADGVMLHPGQWKLLLTVTSNLFCMTETSYLWIIYFSGQEDRCYRSLECNRRTVESTHAKL